MSINRFLKQLTTGDTVRDFAHASKSFVDDTYALQPRYKHLFHVVFNFSPLALPFLGRELTRDDQTNLHLFVKSIDLPQFNIDVEDKNQYNRHRYTQHRINYNDVNITFHDDQADTIRRLWYSYYRFYYQDSEYATDTSSLMADYGQNDIYAERRRTSWGYDRGTLNKDPQTKQFFTDIRVYSMFQKKFIEHTLINPIITLFGHDTHSYADGTLMEHRMSIKYETVAYATGIVNEDFPANFAVNHYDKNPSPLTPAGGGTNSILGPGGVVDGALSVIDSFASGNILGGIFTAGRVFANRRDMDFKRVIKEELKQAGRDFLRGKNPFQNTVFPRLSTTASSLAASGQPAFFNHVGPANSIVSQGKTIQTSTPTPQNVAPNVGNSKVSVNSTNKTTSNPLFLSDTRRRG